MNIVIDKDVAKALYERLLRPAKEGDSTVYTISLSLARELREAIFPQLK